MTAAEYLAWEARQEIKHEFVNRRPVAMAGARRAHSRIAANVLANLHIQLRGKPCQPYGSDMKFQSPNGNFRYPDVTVDCAPFKGDDLLSAEPKVVIEVLSGSNTFFDVTQRLADYQAHPDVRHIAFIDSQSERANHWRRAGNTWEKTDLAGLGGGCAFEDIGAALMMAEIYEGVSFEEEEEEEEA